MAATKLCFVTVGATASFNELIQTVLSDDFLTALTKRGYTALKIQYGKGGKTLFDQAVAKARPSAKQVSVTGFELDTAGLTKYMREAKGNTSSGTASEGVVISHAGSGSVLDALRVSVPLIVVPNTSLLDNHQVELAEALAEQGYVVYGKLDNLSQALSDAEAHRKRQYEWPPVNSGKHSEAHGLKGVIDEEMGFLD